MPCLPALLFLALAPWLAQAEGTLRVCSWNNYIDPQVLESLQKDTGIRVGYHTFATTEELDKALHSGEAIDVAVPSHDTLLALLEDSLLRPLGFTQLPNRSHLGRQLLNKLTAVDPDSHHAVLCLWGAVGLTTNTPQAEAAHGGSLPNSWSLLFDASQSQRLKNYSINLLDTPDETLVILLNYQGHSLGRTASSQIRHAVEVLHGLQPNLRYVDSECYITDLEDDCFCLAMAWTGDALRAAKTGQPTSFGIPQEGSVLFIDDLMIPVSAQHSREAHRFIDYLMQPKIATQITAATLYPSGDADAAGFLGPVLRQQPGLYPDHDTGRHLFALGTPPEKLRPVIGEVWKAFRGASH